MKTQFALVCALAQGVSVAQARIGQRFEVEADNVTFAIDYSDSGSTSPYSVLFRQDGVRSKYRYRRADGYVRKLNIADLRYSVTYRGNGNIRNVNDLNRRRALVEQDADEIEEMDEDVMIPSERRLAILPCADCSTLWDFVCDGGMDTLCDEVKVEDEPLVGETDVENSIMTMCYSLRPMCEEYTGAEVCMDQCEECFRALTFSLEWSDKDSDMDLWVNEPDGTEIRWNDRSGSVGYLDQDSLAGGPEIYRVWGGLSTASDAVLGMYSVSARLVNMRGDAESVTWKLTAQMNGVTVFTETDVFYTNGEQSEYFTYTLTTYIDNGCDNETLASIIAVEGDADRDTETKEGSPGP